MTSREFKIGLERTLHSLGFERAGKLFARRDGGVWTVVAFDTGFGHQWSVSVGFWLEQLGGQRPERLEKSHLYFRLERLVPDHRETNVQAGALDDPDQESAYQQLLAMFANCIDAELRILGTDAGLRKGMRDGRFLQGLVTKEARRHLLT